MRKSSSFARLPSELSLAVAAKRKKAPNSLALSNSQASLHSASRAKHSMSLAPIQEQLFSREDI